MADVLRLAWLAWLAWLTDGRWRPRKMWRHCATARRGDEQVEGLPVHLKAPFGGYGLVLLFGTNASALLP